MSRKSIRRGRRVAALTAGVGSIHEPARTKNQVRVSIRSGRNVGLRSRPPRRIVSRDKPPGLLISCSLLRDRSVTGIGARVGHCIDAGTQHQPQRFSDERQRAASTNTSLSRSPSLRSPRRSCSTAISASSAGPISSALVAAMSFQMSAGLEASRVVSASPRPASARPSCPDRVADHLHQRARGQLRQMAEEREQPIVRVAHRGCAARAPSARDEVGQLLERIAAPGPLG